MDNLPQVDPPVSTPRNFPEELFEPARQRLIALTRRAIPDIEIAESVAWPELLNTIRQARPEWDIDRAQYQQGEVIRRDPTIDDIELLLIAHQPRQPRSNARALAQDGCLQLRSDRISRAVVDAFQPGGLTLMDENAIEKLNRVLRNARGTDDEEFSVEPFWAGRIIEHDSRKSGDLQGIVGFRGKISDERWVMLQKYSPLVIKLQVMLMARIMAEVDGEPWRPITISINQACDDIDLKRKKGAHPRSNKLLVKSLLEIITSSEIAFVFREPNEQQKTKGKKDKKQPRDRWHKLEGPYFQRGHSHDTSSDLFGWTPETFVVAAGGFFACEEWREYNRQVANVAEGLLKITTENQNKHALMLGAYLCFFAKLNNSRPKYFRMQTLIEKVFNSEEIEKAIAQRNIGRLINTIRRALNQLKEAGVIGEWRDANPAEIMEAGIDYDDLDSQDTLDAMAAETSIRRNTAQELNASIVVEWPQPVIKANRKQGSAKAPKLPEMPIASTANNPPAFDAKPPSV